MSKYQPLQQYLTEVPADQAEITLRFSEIDRLLDDDSPLPASAYTHRPWWANEIGGRHVQAHAWVEAGWVVDGVDLAGEWVRFRRM